MAIDPSDLRTLRAALRALPERCRYHGTDTAPVDGWTAREACCDTGVPARRRQRAEQVLQRLERQEE
jgi:hypothetical protein